MNWQLVARGLITGGAILVAFALLTLLTGCAAPEPFPVGPEVSPPIGCQELRRRDGEC